MTASVSAFNGSCPSFSRRNLAQPRRPSPRSHWRGP